MAYRIGKDLNNFPTIFHGIITSIYNIHFDDYVQNTGVSIVYRKNGWSASYKNNTLKILHS